MLQPLDDVLQSQKRGEARGITSICSAHPYVLQAAMRRAFRTGRPVLIESTCNQVNQFGGYTGMTPADFVRFVRSIAAENGLPPERLILGGDHLGPSVWQNEPAASAMQKAAGMVQAYVQAGCAKIHLDASMKLGYDDPDKPLDMEVSAHRAARLAKSVEQAYLASRGQPLCYVIGSEVPVPGGAKTHTEGVRLTAVEDARRTIEVTRAAFMAEGLGAARERVVAVVVQPGVEFGDDFVLDYDPRAARDLARFAATTTLVYEAHSTDYQARRSLRNMVRDHFAILKVGPALTFAFREAVFALAMIENELCPAEERSRLMDVLDETMRRDPRHWQKYYHGRPKEQAFARRFSLSDRIRYYWPDPAVQAALEQLFANLSSVAIPPTLLSQYLPCEYEKLITEG